MIGLYIHIPFCKTICSYCDFPKKVPLNIEQEEKYINILINEIQKYNNYYNQIDTIYIGGGTPNFLSLNLLEKLLSYIDSLNLINIKEYSIECNVELLTEDQVKLFKKYKINRVSLGVQTFNDRLIKLLNRHHDLTDVKNAVTMLKKYNIDNINIDLMFGIFTQTFNEFLEDLNIFLSLNVKHLSYYSLILEENTKLYQIYKESDFNDDDILKMYEYLINNLSNLGYKQYEISNYALNGYESIHNLKYWNKEQYIGVGLGATSYLEHKRYTNSVLINKYLKNEDINIEYLDKITERNEYLMLGLRKINGVNLNEYYNKFNSNILEDYNLNKLINLNLIEIEDNNLKLTKKGLIYGNIVFEEFI